MLTQLLGEAVQDGIKLWSRFGRSPLQSRAQSLYRIGQTLFFNRFDEVVNRAPTKGFHRILFKGRNKHQLGAPSHAARRFNATQARHMDIKKRDLWLELVKKFNRFVSIAQVWLKTRFYGAERRSSRREPA